MLAIGGAVVVRGAVDADAFWGVAFGALAGLFAGALVWGIVRAFAEVAGTV